MASSRLKSRRNQEQGSKSSRIAIAILATIGLVDTGSITLDRWGLIGSLSCPGGMTGCDKVLNSPWGTIFENETLIIPLSFIGFLSYLILLSMAILPLILNKNLNKNNITRNTWWILFYSSCVMSAFSLFLIGLMIYKIQAFCFFCILSAIISILILFLSILGGAWDNLEQLFFRGILLSLSILISSLIWSSNVDPSLSIANNSSNGLPPPVLSQSNVEKIEFAKFLTAKDVAMYSAYWCPHCHDQKELFGRKAYENLNIIECAKDGYNNQSDFCDKKGINVYPSWEINGEINEGVKSLQELAEITGYKKFSNNFQD